MTGFEKRDNFIKTALLVGGFKLRNDPPQRVPSITLKDRPRRVVDLEIIHFRYT